MEISLISVGKVSLKWVEEALKQYEIRIPKYIKYSNRIIPDIKNSRNLNKESQKEEEGKLILSSITPSDFVVIMDERGNEFTSREFADFIQKQMNSGRKRLTFVVGGPYGFSEEIYQRADYKIALSKMTFTHEMARLILTEQIYRGLTILKGEPYHHD